MNKNMTEAGRLAAYGVLWTAASFFPGCSQTERPKSEGQLTQPTDLERRLTDMTKRTVFTPGTFITNETAERSENQQLHNNVILAAKLLCLYKERLDLPQDHEGSLRLKKFGREVIYPELQLCLDHLRSELCSHVIKDSILTSDEAGALDSAARSMTIVADLLLKDCLASNNGPLLSGAIYDTQKLGRMLQKRPIFGGVIEFSRDGIEIRPR